MYGEESEGIIDRNLIKALLISNRTEGWVAVEKLLMAAERQEGLRQSILESLDEGSFEAFRRILQIILDKNLVRFSLVVRSVDVWLGLAWTASKTSTVKKVLEDLIKFIGDEKARETALSSPNNQEAYVALWVYGMMNINEGISVAEKLLQSEQAEKRFIAAKLLAEIRSYPAIEVLQRALEDNDLRVVAQAIAGSRMAQWRKKELFTQLEHLFQRLPAKKTYLEPIVWSWMQLGISKSDAFILMQSLTTEVDPGRFIPYIQDLDVYEREDIVRIFDKKVITSQKVRSTLVNMLSDKSSTVRYSVFNVLKKVPSISEEEAIYFENLLKRKSGDLRRGVLELLLKQNKKLILHSIKRLLNAKDKHQQTAGIELGKISGQGVIQENQEDGTNSVVSEPKTTGTVISTLC